VRRTHGRHYDWSSGVFHAIEHKRGGVKRRGEQSSQEDDAISSKIALGLKYKVTAFKSSVCVRKVHITQLASQGRTDEMLPEQCATQNSLTA